MNTTLFIPELHIYLLVISIIVFYFFKKTTREVFGDVKLNSIIRTGAFVFIQLLVMSLILQHSSTFFGFNDTQNVDEAAQGIASQGVMGALSLSVSALIEEVFFRGIIFSIVNPWFSTLLFGIAHAGYGSLVQLGGALIAGIILMRARSETKSIYPGVAGHILYNLVAVFILT